MAGENTFFDYVGPSPVNVWTATEEWEVLKSVCQANSILSLRFLLMGASTCSRISHSIFVYPSPFRRHSLWRGVVSTGYTALLSKRH